MSKIPKKASQQPTEQPTTPASVTAGFRKTRDDHAVELAQDYVELIEDLIARHGEARLVDIADHIGVSHVTANKTVGRLQHSGLVVKRPYRSVFLTEKGKKLAAQSRKRHRVVFAFLCSIGVPERAARIDTEGIEHHISDATLQAMSTFLQSHPPTKKKR